MAGNSCIIRSTTFLVENRTDIIGDNPVASDGTITSWCVYVETLGGTPSVKLKIFRSDGTNFNFVTEGSLHALSGGLNTFSESIPVLTGDYVGFFTTLSGPDNTFVYVGGSGTGSTYVKGGDISSNSSIASWGHFTNAMSMGATVSPPATTVFVNSSTGNDSNPGDSCTAGHPVQTFQKAYNLLAANGTIFVCNSGADFSVETITFTKGLSVTTNASTGNFFMPKFT